MNKQDHLISKLLGLSPSKIRRNDPVAPAPPGLGAPGGAGDELAIAGDAYEGASIHNRELALWQPPSRSADRDIIPQKTRADARVRDTYRNDAYVQSAAQQHQDGIVGPEFVLNSKPETKIIFGKEDEKWETEFQEEIETRFKLWAQSDDKWPDAGRRNSFTQLIRQAVGSYLVTGEVLAVVEWAREDRNLRAFNTSVRMIDLDRLSTPTNRMSDKNIIAGVQVDRRHIPQGYWIRQAHPRDIADPRAYQWEFVPRRKPWGRAQAIHLFDQRRPNQTRGISDVVAGLKELRQTKDFRETMLQNAVVQATYAASVESDLDTNAIFQRLGGGNLGEGTAFENSIAQYIGAHLSAVSKYMKGSDQFQIGGVRIPHLPPGSKLQLRPAGQGGPLGTDFEKSLLRYLSAATSLSYEQLSRDFSETNYASFRGAMNETWKFMNGRKALVADNFASFIFRLWLEEGLNRAAFESMPRKFKNPDNMGWLYQPQILDAIAACDWIGASRGQIDELKETQASALRRKNTLTTDEDELARLGKDYRRVYRQRRREKLLRDKLEIEDESDLSATNMMNAASGAEREAPDERNEDKEADNKDARTDQLEPVVNV